MHHYDFYRLSEPGVVQNELKETLFLPDSVSCIEWGESVQQVLPPTRLWYAYRRQQKMVGCSRFTFRPHWHTCFLT